MEFSEKTSNFEHTRRDVVPVIFDREEGKLTTLNRELPPLSRKVGFRAGLENNRDRKMNVDIISLSSKSFGFRE
jgi:hypothetical protein